jgi:hypothetical protein
MKENLTTPSDASKKTSKAANGKSTNGKSVHTSPSAHSFAPSTDAVALRAYLLHENHGAAHGHDVDDWLAAETALRAEQGLAHT